MPEPSHLLRPPRFLPGGLFFLNLLDAALCAPAIFKRLPLPGLVPRPLWGLRAGALARTMVAPACIASVQTAHRITSSFSLAACSAECSQIHPATGRS